MRRKAVFTMIISVVSIVVLLGACMPAAKSVGLLGEEQPPSDTEYRELEAGELVGAAPASGMPVAQENGQYSATPVFQPVNYVPAVPGRPNRLIVKNGEMRLEVSNTDTALDGISQIIADVGGYIISSRVWFEHRGELDLKYASATLGVPVDQFEVTLRRLRGLAIQVLDETASGQDVTDEYVDLQSRLDNLVVTRDRIRTFLEQARTVEEALLVNEQLAQVEEQIEQVQGRMNYLFDRSAYSTVSVTLAPEALALEPVKSLWSPGLTFQRASRVLGGILQGVADMLIWVSVVWLPFALPLGLVIWGIARYQRRRQMRTALDNA